MSKMVSVIMPVYNRADLVGESIESLQAQSYTNWELIITESNSTDDSLKVCQSYAEKDSRIKVYSVADLGLSGARNNCLDKAQGEYAFFLDSDDIVHPEILSILVESMSTTGARIGGSGYQFVNNKNWSDAYKAIEHSKKNKTTQY